MENKNIDTLEYLLTLRKSRSKEKKKAEPSKLERDQFYEAWTKLVADEGYSARAEKYLYDCSAYCGAKPFKSYLDHCEDRNDAMNRYFKGEMYGVNSEVTFRLLAHLLALLMNDKKSWDLVPAIIKKFPDACINKEKKRLGTLSKTMDKYFFAALDIKGVLPPLSEMDLKPIFLKEFIETMSSVLAEVNRDGLAKNKIINIEKTEVWIESYRQVPVNQESDGKNVNVVQDQDNSTKFEKEKLTEELEEILTPVVTEQPEQTVPQDLEKQLIDLISSAGKVAFAVRAESVQRKRKNEDLIKSLGETQAKLDQANNQIGELNAVINQLRQKIMEAEGTIVILKQTIEQKDTLIAAKDSEIAERIQMTEVLSRDRSKQADETLQRMASEVRKECLDFYDAAGMEMSNELGEIMRDKLTAILTILEKGGMKIK